MIFTKPKPDYVDLDTDFKPLPKYGHLSRKHPAYEAAEEAISTAYSKLYGLPDIESFRRAAGDADASIPPGGPDRYRDVVTELMYFTTRDGHRRELKVYKSPSVEPNAVLMYRMHGGAWCVGRHEVDGAENVYAAMNKNIVVVSVDYRLAPEHPFPYPLNDSYDGLLWCKENAHLLGVDPERIIISGSSAGATLDPQTFNWRTGGYLSFEVYDGYDAWYGRLPREEYRKDWPYDGVQYDLSRFDELVKLLRPVPKDKIYPVFPAEELTEYTLQQAVDNKAVYLKAPRPCHYRDNSDDLAVRLLNEARIHERIRRHPHRHLDSYLGCVVERGRIVRLAMERYTESLYEYLQRETPESDSHQHIDCMDQIEAAAKHLHSLGLAHNDISPSNIMFDSVGQAVLIDLDSCAPLGNTLTKGGLVTGWKGPIHGHERQYNQSSAECDMEAIQEIRESIGRT